MPSHQSFSSIVSSIALLLQFTPKCDTTKQIEDANRVGHRTVKLIPSKRSGSTRTETKDSTDLFKGKLPEKPTPNGEIMGNPLFPVKIFSETNPLKVVFN